MIIFLFVLLTIPISYLHKEMLRVFSPIEQFEVASLIHIQSPLLNYTTISLTNIGLYILLGVSLICGLQMIGMNNLRLVPSRWGLLLESLYDTIYGILRSQLNASQEQYLPFLYSLFMFILVTNLLGNVTYSYCASATLVISLGISFAVFIGVTILSISIHGIKFVNFFVPSGVPNILLPLLVPIEFISYLSRSVSLGVRLFANLVAGHALITILAGFIVPAFTNGVIYGTLALLPFSLFISIVALEVAVSFIQAYVFTVLTSSYIKDAIYLH